MADFSHVLMVADLDGTFFGDGARLVERNLEAVARFKAQGGRFTTATGRIRQDIARAIPNAAALFNAPAITSNGAYLYDFSTERCVGETSMDAYAVCELVRFAQSLDPHVAARVSTASGFLANADRLNDYVRFDISHYTHFEAQCLPLDEWNPATAKWYKMVIRGTYEELRTVRPQVEEKFGDIFEYSSSSPTFFEIQAGGVTKASAMCELASKYAAQDGYPIVTVAVGDHENDLPMLSAADVAACPENALDMVKSVCRHHLCACDEGAIADLVERLEAAF